MAGYYERTPEHNAMMKERLKTVDYSGRKAYERTPEHKKKMSKIISGMQEVTERAKQNFIRLNRSKKGKTIEELYGQEKATILRESLRKQKDEKNPNWRGGISRIPYPKEFSKKLRDLIKARDKFRCQICDRHENELRELDVLKRGLDIDHIDHDKNNNKESNLISLCRKCNGRKNSRKDWQEILRQKATKNSLGA